MKAILLPIETKCASAIYDGVQEILLRKEYPNFNIGATCLVCEPLPIGRITGWFVYSGAFRFVVDEVNLFLLSRAHISLNDYNRLYYNQQFGFAWCIESPQKFIKPIEFNQLHIEHCPDMPLIIDLNEYFWESL